jgi:hypothetical protein
VCIHRKHEFGYFIRVFQLSIFGGFLTGNGWFEYAAIRSFAYQFMIGFDRF